MSPVISNLVFYGFALVSIMLALLVVTTPRILRAAVYLMGVLAASAAFFVLLDAEFLAGVQILVYVGGIVVLLVFAVMLTRSVELLEEKPEFGRRALAAVGSLAFFAVVVGVLLQGDFPPLRAVELQMSNTAALGRKLLDPGPQGFVLPFEIISLLLLSGVLGGIVIARKTPAEKEGK